MNNYSHIIDLIKNQAEKKKISANALLNIIIRTIEATEKINGEDASKSRIEDASGFADDIWYLSGRLIDAIKNNEKALDELPGSLKPQFDEDYRQLSSNNEKLREIHEQLCESNKQKEELNETITSLRSQLKDLEALTTEIDALDKLRTKLSSELSTNSERIAEYNNTLSIIKNAMGSLSSKPDIVEIIESSNGIVFESLNMKSFVDLQKWFNMMEESLKQGIELYTQAYSTLLKEVEDSTQKD